MQTPFYCREEYVSAFGGREGTKNESLWFLTQIRNRQHSHLKVTKSTLSNELFQEKSLAIMFECCAGFFLMLKKMMISGSG